MMSVLRICRRRWPRREAAAWWLIALGCAAAFLAPHGANDSVRVALMLAMVGHYILFSALFMWLAWRDGRLDERILSLYGLVNIVVALHDMLGFPEFNSLEYWSTPGTIITVTFVALVLGRNFAANLQRIEEFNVDLQSNVEKARTELTAALRRQHELELVHVRLGERVGLAHDLHDGLGGMLIHNIAMLEQAPEQMPSRQVLGIFHQLRDDLRLIIDTASAQHYGEHSLAALLGPLRHRMTQMLEAHGIALCWRVSGVDQVYPTTTQSLDLLRILQEALTNVLKHSGASCASVDLHRAAGRLTLEINDDGAGFATSAGNGLGTGMRSMRARAQRLGAKLITRSDPGNTMVRLSMPWARSEETAGASPAAVEKPAALMS
jgi:signal transduction histidine kinase